MRRRRARPRASSADGFRDATGSYLTDRLWTGVWLSNVPLDQNEGAKGVTLLIVDLDVPEADLAEFEWVQEESGGYREWLIPAAIINPAAVISLAPDDESE